MNKLYNVLILILLTCLVPAMMYGAGSSRLITARDIIRGAHVGARVVSNPAVTSGAVPSIVTTCAPYIGAILVWNLVASPISDTIKTKIKADWKRLTNWFPNLAAVAILYIGAYGVQGSPGKGLVNFAGLLQSCAANIASNKGWLTFLYAYRLAKLQA
jgi:hypothetical protein